MGAELRRNLQRYKLLKQADKGPHRDKEALSPTLEKQSSVRKTHGDTPGADWAKPGYLRNTKCHIRGYTPNPSNKISV